MNKMSNVIDLESAFIRYKKNTANILRVLDMNDDAQEAICVHSYVDGEMPSYMRIPYADLVADFTQESPRPDTNKLALHELVGLVVQKTLYTRLPDSAPEPFALTEIVTKVVPSSDIPICRLEGYVTQWGLPVTDGKTLIEHTSSPIMFYGEC